MSTDKVNRQSRTTANNRFACLAALDEDIFHASDLVTLWGITKKNTLYTTLKRYTAQGYIHRIHPGLYSIKPLNELDPVLLGMKALHRYSYVSTETILVRAGIIFQNIPAITFVSSLTRRFTIGGHEYICRQLSNRYLYNDCGIEMKDGILTATPERAVADMLYFNPSVYFDASEHIKWEAVTEIQKSIGYPTKKYL